MRPYNFGVALALAFTPGFIYGYLCHRSQLFPAQYISTLVRSTGLKQLFNPSRERTYPSYSTLDVTEWYGYERWEACKRTFEQSPLRHDVTRVLWVGDSILKEMYVEHFLPNSVNVGTSSMGTKLLYDERHFLDGFQQHVLILYLGANDLDEGVSFEDAFPFYQRLVEHFVERNKEVILLGLHRGFDGAKKNKGVDEFNKRIEELANKHKFMFVPTPDRFYDQSGFMKRRLSYDGEHLNTEAYELWMDEIRPCVERAMTFRSGASVHSETDGRATN